MRWPAVAPVPQVDRPVPVLAAESAQLLRSPWQQGVGDRFGHGGFEVDPTIARHKQHQRHSAEEGEYELELNTSAIARNRHPPSPPESP